MDLIPDIYFEKQEGNLCAQHALNALLQDNYFSAVDLAEIARDLDKQEQLVGSKKENESQNYDDSGYFSIQVLQKALEIWKLELIPWKSKSMEAARKNPVEQVGFICNLRNHWFTLRKFVKSHRWYNLDSTQENATYLGENYLALMIDQIEAEGYSVFVVKGDLPTCSADQKALILGMPQLREKDYKQPTFKPFSGQGYSLSSQQVEEEDEEILLARAIQASLEDSKPNASNDMDEIRRKRLARFGA